MIFSEGEAWKNKRKLISKVFNFDLKENIPKIAEICDKNVDVFGRKVIAIILIPMHFLVSVEDQEVVLENNLNPKSFNEIDIKRYDSIEVSEDLTLSISFYMSKFHLRRHLQSKMID